MKPRRLTDEELSRTLSELSAVEDWPDCGLCVMQLAEVPWVTRHRGAAPRVRWYGADWKRGTLWLRSTTMRAPATHTPESLLRAMERAGWVGPTPNVLWLNPRKKRPYRGAKVTGMWLDEAARLARPKPRKATRG